MTTRYTSTCLLSLVALLGAASLVAAADFMFRANINGETIEGQPLHWTANEMTLLGRDGKLHEFNPKDAKDAVKTSPRFQAYSMAEMKRELYREFGDDLAITTTSHYIVAHPRGDRSDWANRFEDLYRWCLAYFRVRGFEPKEPAYPLVAVVYPNKAEYYRAAAARGRPLPSGTLGNYDLDSNRVYLYDTTAGKKGGDWSGNADTIIHEATHQTAFNTGIHNRFTETPRWLVEGLATLFEARGVWNSLSFHTQKDRINEGRLRDFQSLLPSRKPGTMLQLISSDRMFQTNVGAAYAEAWALAFYLCETRPREFVRYLEMTAARANSTEYRDAQRVADFTECFGSDMKQLEANFLSWMKDVK